MSVNKHPQSLITYTITHTHYIHIHTTSEPLIENNQQEDTQEMTIVILR